MSATHNPFFAHLQHKNHLYVLIQNAVYFMLLFTFSRALFPALFLDSTTANTQSNAALKLLDIGLAGCVLLTALPVIVTLLYTLWQNKLLLFFGVYVLLTSFFSENVPAAFLQGTEFVFAIFAGTLIGITVSFPRYYRLLLCIFGVITVLSLVVVIIAPSFGYHPLSNTYWRGIFQNKNSLGLAAGISFMLFLCYSLHSRGDRRLAGYALAFISALLLVKSGSITFLFATAACTGALLMWILYQKKHIASFLLAIIIIMALCIMVPLGLIFFEEILAFFGKDTTLTGRTINAMYTFDTALENPLFGLHGPATGVQSNYAYYKGQLLLFETKQSDSGLLNLFLYYGLVGFVCTLALIGLALKRTWHVSCTYLTTLSFFPVMYLLYFIIGSITEGIAQGPFYWMLLTSFIVGARKWAV